jgi:hypothetical protein
MYLLLAHELRVIIWSVDLFLLVFNHLHIYWGNGYTLQTTSWSSCERIRLFLACMHTCGLLIHLHRGLILHCISLAHLLMLFDGAFWLEVHVIPILWITKKIMSRGPQVANMEYWETTWPTIPFCTVETPLTTTGGHIFPDGIHQISWLPEGSQPCSMRYKSVLW